MYRLVSSHGDWMHKQSLEGKQDGTATGASRGAVKRAAGNVGPTTSEADRQLCPLLL